MNTTTKANQIYRVGLTWYVRIPSVAHWFNGRAVRNDRSFGTRAQARAYIGKASQ